MLKRIKPLPSAKTESLVRCGATRENVTEDIQQLSQLTRRIRMYGMACNQTEFVLDAIAQTKVNSTSKCFHSAHVSRSSKPG